MIMMPKIELDPRQEVYTKKEVEAMTSALSEAYINLFKAQVASYKFAKAVSYISLFIALLLIGKELFR